MSTKPNELIASALIAILAPVGVDIEGVEITPAGKRRVIRVMVDSDGGISLDQVAEVTHLVSAELDRLDQSGVLGESPYTLEVTSPGIDRPLTLPRHWRRNLTRLVKCSLPDGSTLVGRVISADEIGALLDVDGIERFVEYVEVRRALVEIEFNRVGEQ